MKIKLFMKLNSIFVDTSFFKAFLDPEDDFNRDALMILKRLAVDNPLFVTTNFILDESYTLLRVRKNLDFAIKLREFIYKDLKGSKVVIVSPEDEAEAWKWFLNPWKGLSFTDCTSFAVMKRLELSEVATFDNHFSKAGFKVLS